jgi:hypothetical protein
VDWAEMCIQQYSHDNYDALVKKNYRKSMKFIVPKRKQIFTEKRSLGSHVLSNLEKCQQNLYQK